MSNILYLIIALAVLGYLYIKDRESLRVILVAALLATAIRTTVFEPFRIPSGSMIPTLLVGDYVIVSKYSYGYSRYSMPFGLPLFKGRLFESPPQRGDVAVFRLPSNPRIDYIKRLIGLPGDTVQVKKGRLYINGEQMMRHEREPYQMEDQDGSMVAVKQYIEELPDQITHPILEVSDAERLDDTEIFKVPEGHYFFMGDNRDRSLDSRVSSFVGLVPAQNLIGRAEFLFFSNDGFKIRWNRLFKTID